VHYRDIRKFGRFTLVEDGRYPAAIHHVGPDMLAVRFATWYPRIAGRRAPIKALLLDQGIAAGLGNIYVDEALFRAGVHPATPAADLARDELRTILRCGKAVMRLAIRHGGTTYINFTNFHGKPGNFRRKLRVYGRTGEPCRRCGAPLERMVVGGRSSHFCPACQPRR
jgi:formamidopyrimidine-DNA glycosylase